MNVVSTAIASPSGSEKVSDTMTVLVNVNEHPTRLNSRACLRVTSGSTRPACEICCVSFRVRKIPLPPHHLITICTFDPIIDMLATGRQSAGGYRSKPQDTGAGWPLERKSHRPPLAASRNANAGLRHKRLLLTRCFCSTSFQLRFEVMHI